MSLTLCILLLYLMSSATLSMLFARKQSNKGFLLNYFAGSRSVGGIMLAFTMATTYTSASSFLGGPALAAHYGLSWVLLACVQYSVIFLIMGVIGKKIAQSARQTGAISLGDFVYSKYKSHGLVVTLALFQILFFSIYIAVNLAGGAQVFKTFLNLDYVHSLLIFSLTIGIYAFFGGFKAIAFNNTLQGFVMVLGCFFLLVALLNNGGGMSTIVQNIKTLNSNLLHPTSGGNLSQTFISSFWILVGLGLLGLPTTAAIAMGFKSNHEANKSIILGTIVLGLITLIIHLIGFMGVSFGEKANDGIIASLAKNNFSPVLAGIFLGAPTGAILSTVDTILIGCSAAFIKDILLRARPQTKQIKFITIAFNFFIFGVASFIVLNPPSFLVWLNLFSIGGQESAYFALIIFGLWTKKPSTLGAYLSAILGVGIYLLFYWKEWSFFGAHLSVVGILSSIAGYAMGLGIEKLNS